MSEYLDEDGYPTEEALEKIKDWSFDDFNDPKDWFKFIENIWHLRSWGWAEDYNEKGKYQYNISTAGWSGNESIIRAMQENKILWYYSWVQSRRGGHYIFEVRNEQMETN